MREIKFRAWDNSEKEMLFDVQNAYDYGCKGGGVMEESFGDLLNNERYVVEQFTGLLDKNGKEIYEGDVVKMRLGCDQMDISEYDLIVNVEYGRKGYGSEIGFSGFSEQGQIAPLAGEGRLEIIGNIHEGTK